MDACNGHQTDLAFVLTTDLKFSFQPRQQPRAKAWKDVVVEVVATGLCGSDIHYWLHGAIGDFKVDRPIILGHESAGIVRECAEGVSNLWPGDRVALEPGVPCRICRFCKSGRYNLCTDMEFAATPPFNGTLSTHYILPEDYCHKIPVEISFEEGAMIEPLSVAVHSARLGDIRPGSNVLVLGAGPVGLLCCAVARTFGAHVVACTDIVQERVDFARVYAATHTHLMSGDSQIDKSILLQSLPAGRTGFDVVVDATGVESCITCGIHALDRGATFVQVGLGRPKIAFPVADLCSKEGVYKGSFRYSAGDYELSIELVRNGKVNVKDLITHRFDFRDAQAAFESVAARKGMKTIIYGQKVSSGTAKQA